MGIRKRGVADKTGEEIEQYYWDPTEHTETWYWLKYVGPKGRWRPPSDWKKTRKLLVSQGHSYWQPYAYPKNSWVGCSEEEVNKIKLMLTETNYKHFYNIYDIADNEVDDATNKVISSSQRKYTNSIIYYFPETDLVIKRWRFD